jgi:hypothetical protein
LVWARNIAAWLHGDAPALPLACLTILTACISRISCAADELDESRWAYVPHIAAGISA